MKDAMNIKTKEPIALTDLGLVTALSLTFTYRVLKHTDSNKVYFLFDPITDVQTSIDKYWQRSLLVDARDYAEQLKSIKSRIYGEFNR